MTSTIGAVAEAVTLALKIINRYVDDPKRRARAIADYITELQKLKDQLDSSKDLEELDKILLSIIEAKP